MANIQTRVESARGCGYRKPGGTYLVSTGIHKHCCILPQELSVCPCCGEGIKQSRGFTWVSSALLTNKRTCTDNVCPLLLATMMEQRMGLMWVGEKYYKTALQFSQEGERMGVSKRIATIPNDFEVGKTWVLLAHPKAVMKNVNGETNREQLIEWFPGIFQVFIPTAIDYVVGGWETDDELNRLEKRGVTLVKVIRDVDLQTTAL